MLMALMVTLWHVQHLVEITIVEITLIIHAYHGAAHQGRQGLAIVAVAQQLHVVVELIMGQQHRTETTDRHVGNRQQMIEAQTEMRHQFTLVVSLQRRLGRRQRRASGVINKVKNLVVPVAFLVQALIHRCGVDGHVRVFFQNL